MALPPSIPIALFVPSMIINKHTIYITARSTSVHEELIFNDSVMNFVPSSPIWFIISEKE